MIWRCFVQVQNLIQTPQVQLQIQIWHRQQYLQCHQEIRRDVGLYEFLTHHNPNWYVDGTIRCMFWPEMGLRWHSLDQPTNQPAGQIPSLTMGDSAAEAGTTLKLRMSSELKKFWRALVQAKKPGGGRNLDAAQTTNISFSLARNSTKCGSGSAHIWHLHH